MDGKTSVLLCTTIIESGLDMPNVNTLIVDEADRLGLAQLYQIRGRIGRSNRVAYAYLTYRPDRSITETAQKRLNAIREFTDLGSGMRIALRDLEIRGAGNILGPEQHGYIEAVGFDLYCRLLEEETARTRGEIPVRREIPQLDIKVDSYIPDTYIDDPGLKIQVYRQAMMANNLPEITEIEKGLRDRFGPPPPPVQNLLRISRLRLTARDKSIRHINTDSRQIELTLDNPLGVRVEGLANLAQRYGMKISVTNQNTLVLKSSGGLSLEALEDLLGVI
jgi:transcription-repair coupling factor (superfamily II helicase)